MTAPATRDRGYHQARNHATAAACPQFAAALLADIGVSMDTWLALTPHGRLSVERAAWSTR